jgi:hypothetical protein
MVIAGMKPVQQPFTLLQVFWIALSPVCLHGKEETIPHERFELSPDRECRPPVQNASAGGRGSAGAGRL